MQCLDMPIYKYVQYIMYYTYIYAFRVCYIRLGCKYIRLHKRKAKWPATLLMMISDDQAATDDDIYRW